jgi:8-oxo-dGTP diphosphatase
MSIVKPCFVYVEGIYVKGGRILLFKRKVEPFNGFWHAVGGQVEENESLSSALKREYKEETTLDVQVGEVLGVRTEETSDRTKIIIALKVSNAAGAIKLNEENSERRWFSQSPPKSVCDYSKFLK